MKQVVVTFGLLSGAVSAAIMSATMPFAEAIGFDRMIVVGYTAIVISFLFVYFGIRSYRDHVLGGLISFGKAFQAGAPRARARPRSTASSRKASR